MEGIRKKIKTILGKYLFPPWKSLAVRNFCGRKDRRYLWNFLKGEFGNYVTRFSGKLSKLTLRRSGAKKLVGWLNFQGFCRDDHDKSLSLFECNGGVRGKTEKTGGVWPTLKRARVRQTHKNWARAPKLGLAARPRKFSVSGSGLGLCKPRFEKSSRARVWDLGKMQARTRTHEKSRLPQPCRRLKFSLKKLK